MCYSCGSDTRTPVASYNDQVETVKRESANFAEFVSYAQKICGGSASPKKSQGDLADLTGISTTMLGRYKAGLINPWSVSSAVVEALARAARVEPSIFFIWIQLGKRAAMERQRQLAASPAAGVIPPEPTPLDLARQLVDLLAAQAADASTGSGHGRADGAGLLPPRPRLDLAAIRRDLDQLEAASPTLFARLVVSLDATAAVDAVRADPGPTDLDDDCWLALARLLDQDPISYRAQRVSSS